MNDLHLLIFESVYCLLFQAQLMQPAFLMRRLVDLHIMSC